MAEFALASFFPYGAGTHGANCLSCDGGAEARGEILKRHSTDGFFSKRVLDASKTMMDECSEPGGGLACGLARVLNCLITSPIRITCRQRIMQNGKTKFRFYDQIESQSRTLNVCGDSHNTSQLTRNRIAI